MHVSEALATRPLILVVEEAHSLRRLLARALLQAGYHVLTAADPAEATALLERLQLQPALAIVDLHASLLSGAEVAQALARGQAEVPIIFVARYIDDPDAVLPGLIIEKPFTFGPLCRTVGNVLARGTPLFSTLDDDPAW
jgi:two-component system, cell cycle sensor histidine kinase and response regulator CckA